MSQKPIRLVDAGWGQELTEAIRGDSSEVRIICPFIKESALKYLLEEDALKYLLSHRPGDIQVITRFNLADFANGVSDVEALRMLFDSGVSIRGIRNLHAKLYLFGKSRAIITSANLTKAALTRNQEFGVVAYDRAVIAACRNYFDKLWQRGSSAELSHDRLDCWAEKVARYCLASGRSRRERELGDFGADADLEPPLPILPVVGADADQAFIKFLGNSHERVPVSHPIIEVIKHEGCHEVLAYPKTKRPRSVEDGAIMFMARFTEKRDIRIFGRAVGMKHDLDRDNASPEDIDLRWWREKYSRYIRVDCAEFVAGTIANGISLNELMCALGSNSFASTQHNAARGSGNTNPRRAYGQQAAVKLSSQAIAWLGKRLQAAFDAHGKVPQDRLDQLD